MIDSDLTPKIAHGMFSARALLCTTCLATSTAAVTLLGSQSAQADRASQSPDAVSQLIEQPQRLRSIDTMRVEFQPIELRRKRGPQTIGGVATGGCPTEVGVYTDANFAGGAYTQQQGFAQNNVAAISITVSPEKFPLRLDMTELIFATSGAIVSTTTEWTLLVWEGRPLPGQGQLIEQFSSDDIILPHLVIPPGTHGVNVQVIVDPSDPEPIIINNYNNSNTFTIGYRIDKHNQPASILPNCFPAPANQNAFPVTDVSGVAAPQHNWVGSPNCDPFGCIVGGGFATFQSLGACSPSGDWVMRATYTPLVCPTVVGACCLPSGTCQILESVECANLGGMFQGEGLTCVGINCPEPMGACCTGAPGACSDLTLAQCDAIDGFWNAETNCDSNICATGEGACCIESTGECVDLDVVTCDIVDGIFHGIGSSCVTTVCFPIGACCLPDGSCVNSVSPESCESLDGLFQGHASTCESVTCPAPTAACCLPNGNCLVFTENTCAAVGGTWNGIGTTCEDSNGNGTADICEDDEPCAGDINGDGFVDVSDLLLLFGSWGSCPGCSADLNNDNVVDVSDLLLLFSAWGSC